MERRSRCFHRQSFNDCDTNRAERFSVTKTEADMKSSRPNDGFECPQNDPG